MVIPFTKMHGCGNDYIYIDCLERNGLSFVEAQIEKDSDHDRTCDTLLYLTKNDDKLGVTKDFIEKISDRHFGIGSDGVVFICESDVATAKMRMFNSDGSEGMMCGNAIRCLARYLYEHQYTKLKNISVETLSGIKNIEIINDDKNEFLVKVNMGKPSLDPKDIGINMDVLKNITAPNSLITSEYNNGNKNVIYENNRKYSKEEFVIEHPILIDNTAYYITCVSMGNPHTILFVKNVEKFDVARIGKMLSTHQIFERGCNIEFAEVIDEHNIKMRVYERGSGETLACGTGACAAAFAFYISKKGMEGPLLNGELNNKAEGDTSHAHKNINVEVLGGILNIEYQSHVFMLGKASFVFNGIVDSSSVY